MFSESELTTRLGLYWTELGDVTKDMPKGQALELMLV